MKCRHCESTLETVFVDLNSAPPSNAYLTAQQLEQKEYVFPLKLYVCEQCWLVQTEDVTDADQLFTDDYAYFSSTSAGWLKHAADYCEEITQRLGLDSSSFVVELAANDGYLLKNFVANNIPCLGIEPTKSTGEAAQKLGVPIMQAFFTKLLAKKLVEEGKQADLIIGNNVFAHVPAINDFTKGMEKLLKPDGLITLEFPHLLQLIDKCQFDTIYHEHFSYLSLTTVSRIFDKAGLKVCDVEVLSTHGGSLRVYGCHKSCSKKVRYKVKEILEQEAAFGLLNVDTYRAFQAQVDDIKHELHTFLTEQKKLGKSVVAYGAAAKGNTLLNYSKVTAELLPAVVDAAPAKQGLFLPGSHIPIYSPSYIAEVKPDYVVILPWNIADEVMEQQAIVRSWGGKFLTVIPKLTVY